MPSAKPTIRQIPKPGLLRVEIGIAMAIKLILLIGLWALIFRWQDKPPAKPDMATHLALPSGRPESPSQP